MKVLWEGEAPAEPLFAPARQEPRPPVSTIMNCPQEISNIILQILKDAALQIRAYDWNGDAERCAAEADHIHNLPQLIQNYKPELLTFYWDCERPVYLRDLNRPNPSHSHPYAAQWGQLEIHVQRIKEQMEHSANSQREAVAQVS